MALRLGLIGRGRWGQNIERTLASFPDVSVVPIARGATRPEALDGVLIATPSATHAEIALPYIEAGIATFIEKPMATLVTDAELIAAAALRSGAPVFVGHLYLYHPAFLKLLELLPTLGPVHSIICESGNDQPRTDSSVLWDWLPHDLAIAHVIFKGAADGVRAWKLLGDTRTEVAVSEFRFGSTGVVSMTSWHSSAHVRRTTVVCDRAILIFDDKAGRKLALHRKDGTVSYPGHSSESPLIREIGAFLKAVRSREPNASHLETGIATVRAIAAAARSIESGGQFVLV